MFLICKTIINVISQNSAFLFSLLKFPVSCFLDFLGAFRPFFLDVHKSIVSSSDILVSLLHLLLLFFTYSLKVAEVLSKMMRSILSSS